jgi:hypothetical protein
MKIGRGVKQKAGGDAEDQAADKQRWTIVGHEVLKGFHTVPFLGDCSSPLAIMSSGIATASLDREQIFSVGSRLYP